MCTYAWYIVKFTKCWMFFVAHHRTIISDKVFATEQRKNTQNGMNDMWNYSLIGKINRQQLNATFKYFVPPICVTEQITRNDFLFHIFMTGKMKHCPWKKIVHTEYESNISHLCQYIQKHFGCEFVQIFSKLKINVDQSICWFMITILVGIGWCRTTQKKCAHSHRFYCIF